MTLTVPIQNVSIVEETEACSLLAIKLSPQVNSKGINGSMSGREIRMVEESGRSKKSNQYWREVGGSWR